MILLDNNKINAIGNTMIYLLDKVQAIYTQYIY